MEKLLVLDRIEDYRKSFDLIKSSGIIIDPADAVESLSPTLDSDGYFDYIDTDFKCLLDNQVVSYLISLVNGKVLNARSESDVYRSAAALQAFLFLCSIQSEPSIAFAEYTDLNGLEIADKKLAVFRAADNLPMDILLDIAGGYKDYVATPYVQYFPSGELQRAAASQPEKIKAFEINLTIIKKAILLRLDGQNGVDALIKLFDWKFHHYIYTRPSIHFLAVYLSSRPFKNMIKSKDYKGARNAAWDLCLLQEWVTFNLKSPNKKTLLASFDKSIQAAAKVVFRFDSSDDNEYRQKLDDHYQPYWPNSSTRATVIDMIVRFDIESKSAARDANADGNNKGYDFILRVREKIENEFISRVAT